jgi:septal ring factor EnvC (AmiA/AmiB activator)
MAAQLGSASDLLAARSSELEAVRRRCQEAEERAAGLGAELASLGSARTEAENRLAQAEERLAAERAEHERALKDVLRQMDEAAAVPVDPAIARAVPETMAAGSDVAVPVDGEPAGGDEASSGSKAEPPGGPGPSAASVVLAAAMGSRIQRMAAQLGSASDLLAARSSELEAVRRRCQEAEERAAGLGAERDSLAAARAELVARFDGAESEHRRLAALADELRQHEELTAQRLAVLAGSLGEAAGDYRQRSDSLASRLLGLIGGRCKEDEKPV